jgi:hypothetical protein
MASQISLSHSHPFERLQVRLKKPGCADGNVQVVVNLLIAPLPGEIAPPVLDPINLFNGTAWELPEVLYVDVTGPGQYVVLVAAFDMTSLCLGPSIVSDNLIFKVRSR